jgi:hypothetical protein
MSTPSNSPAIEEDNNMSQSPVSYAKDIKPLFNEQDKSHMEFMLDLWSYDDVKSNADAILDSVAKGRMPPNNPWPADRVDTFKQWIAGGCQP